VTLRRALAALVGLCFPGLLSGSACSIPTRENSQAKISPCVEGCPGSDAATDGPTEASQVGFDGGVDGNTRNANCGEQNTCTPDLSDAIWSCNGAFVQQPNDPSPTKNPKTPDGSNLGKLGDLTPAAQQQQQQEEYHRGQACQVVRNASEAQPSAQARCVRAGKAREGEACRGVYADTDGVLLADCAPGLACVRGADSPSDGATGQCRPYCCFGADACVVGSWCTARRLFESNTSQDALFVPACIPADNCALLEPGSCPAGLACILVADRTTSCDVPGKGESGHACPCKEGFACSRDTNTCRAICRIGAVDACQSGVCVGGGDVMPSGFGLCSEL